MLANGHAGYTTRRHVIKRFAFGSSAALVDVTGTGQADARVPDQGRRVDAGTNNAQCAGLVRMADGQLAAAINEGGQAVVMFFNR